MKKLKDKIRTIFVTTSKITDMTVTFRTIPSSLKIDILKKNIKVGSEVFSFKNRNAINHTFFFSGKIWVK